MAADITKVEQTIECVEQEIKIVREKVDALNDEDRYFLVEKRG
jgi:hypothetical protein